jgi:hypothetical protein
MFMIKGPGIKAGDECNPDRLGLTAHSQGAVLWDMIE